MLKPTMLITALALASHAGLANARVFDVAPEPSWVHHLAIPADGAAAASDSVGGLRTLMVDAQVRFALRDEEDYHRQVSQIRSSQGLDTLSHLSFEFDPFERLTFHYIHILRRGRVIDALRADEVKIVRSEKGLDGEILRGASSAVVVLSDLRVGDTLDVAVSVAGRNPIFGAHYFDRASTALPTSVRHLHRRWIGPLGLPLRFKSHGTPATPSVIEHGEEREYLWERFDVPASASDGDLPEWYDDSSWLQVSSFTSWNDVARWAAKLFTDHRPASPALTARIEAWRRSLPSPEARLLAALAFVREEVRYFGVEIGQNSHLPHSPNEVFAHRFGDCKDKALLLVTMLRALGIEAEPALVNTKAGPTLDAWLPTGGAFDHAIVRVRLGGRDRWIDPTQSFQRGALDQLETPRFGRALVADERTTELAVIEAPAPDEPTKTVVEHYTVGQAGEPADLEVVTRYRGAEADRMRGYLSDRSPAEMNTLLLNARIEQDAQIDALAPPAIEDDKAADTVAITERYRLPHFWGSGERSFVADAMREAFRRPTISRRRTPLGVRHPVFVDQTLRIDMPDPPSIEEEERTLEDEATRFHFAAHREDKSIVLHYRLQSLRDAVPAPDVERHLGMLTDVEGHVGYRLVRRRGDSSADVVVGVAMVVLIPGMVGIYFLTGYLRRRLRRRRLRRRVAHASGETASTALVFGSRGALDRHVERLSCRCRRAYDPQSVLEDRVAYGGRALVVVKALCTACGQRARIYADLGA